MPTDNIIFDLAEKFIQETARPIFLTGKAGTGKTTFLRHIKATSAKKTVVVAPTGVAAIHAGGTTIHSFFQLPFAPFIPQGEWGYDTGKHALLKNMKVDAEKRKLFREVELLIVDEVSMVRCDILDAMDTVLRHFRRKPYVPFGGVQVVFIGDLFQLPPVIPDGEWKILRQYYEGPFFFHAQVVQQSRPLYLELKKIYRQSDDRFIALLNSVRNNLLDEADLDLLNSRYLPAFESTSTAYYITITTHNNKADARNAAALGKLESPLSEFHGEAVGEFPERNFPTDKVLKLKVGAQVMFIKNDTERVRRYYNGKIGVVKRIANDEIVVVFPNEETELVVTRDTWVNIRYRHNEQTHQIEEEILGTFTQFGIRLAWAITIHKSQGLTFERVIIDAARAFAAGQVYVALSRCTSIDGVVLSTRIPASAIMTDERVAQFAREESSPDELLPILAAERKAHTLGTLLDLFDWTPTIDFLEIFQQMLEKRKFQSKPEALERVAMLLSTANSLHKVAQRFQEQLKKLLREESNPSNQTLLMERVEAAKSYFEGKWENELIIPLRDHQETMTNKPRVKGYLKELKALLAFCVQQQARLVKANGILEAIQQIK